MITNITVSLAGVLNWVLHYCINGVLHQHSPRTTCIEVIQSYSRQMILLMTVAHIYINKYVIIVPSWITLTDHVKCQVSVITDSMTSEYIPLGWYIWWSYPGWCNSCRHSCTRSQLPSSPLSALYCSTAPDDKIMYWYHMNIRCDVLTGLECALWTGMEFGFWIGIDWFQTVKARDLDSELALSCVSELKHG